MYFRNVDEEYEEIVREEDKLLETETNLGKLGLSKDSSRSEQKQALLWALLASYLPEGILTNNTFNSQFFNYDLSLSFQMFVQLKSSTYTMWNTPFLKQEQISLPNGRSKH